MKSITLLVLLFCLISSIGKSQNYYFNNSISRPILENYLKRAVTMQNLSGCAPGGIPTYTDVQLAEDLNMIRNLKPKFIGRVAGTWGVGVQPCEFQRSKYLADQLHAIDPDIILQAGIYETIDEAIGTTNRVPDYVLNAFGLPSSTPVYFNIDSICYSDWRTNSWHQMSGGVPDMNKNQAQMWFYYKATTYISNGYEALHFGQFALMDDNDSNHAGWWKVLSKIRSFAAVGSAAIGNSPAMPKARRGIVLCDAHIPGNLTGNDLPYYNGGSYAYNTKLLFDLHSSPLDIKEGWKVYNPHPVFADLSNYPNCDFGTYDREGVILTGTGLIGVIIGGITAMNWGWSAQESSCLPYLAEFDSGAAKSPTLEGTLTDQASNWWLLWGWDAMTWYAYQSKMTRNVFFTYAYYKQKELDQNGFCQFPLYRLTYTYTVADPNIPYRANTNYSGQEETIKALWNGSYNISFCTPPSGIPDFCYNLGWRDSKHIRTASDVNADGFEDIVAFGDGNVNVSINNGTSFLSSTAWTHNFCFDEGWTKTDHVRIMADVDGDQRKDIIGFGNQSVLVGKSNGSTFNVSEWTNNFSNAWVWTNLKHIRTAADVNGDSKSDIVGFGDGGVIVALSTGAGLDPNLVGFPEFGYEQGWRIEKHTRLMGDINGDQKMDIVGFKDDGTIYSISNGTSFSTVGTLNYFGYNQGWTNDRHIRTLADVTGDGKADIVCFGEDGVYVAISTGTGFNTPEYWILNFGASNIGGGWSTTQHVRTMADVNGDAKADIVGFGTDGTWVSLSGGSLFTYPQYYNAFGNNTGWVSKDYPRILANIDTDNHLEIVGFGSTNLYTMNCTSTYTFREGTHAISSNDKAYTVESSVSIYPNPSDRDITLKCSICNGKEYTVNLYNQTGQKVFSVNQVKEEQRLNIPFLENGIYFVIISDNHQIIKNEKLIINH